MEPSSDDPIRVSVSVPLSQQRAFRLFTERVHLWWPLADFSLSGADADTCAIEPFAGGKVFESSKNGERQLWGDVVVYEPPQRVVLSWYVGGKPPTEVEIQFTPSDDGTLVELEHRGWAAFGDLAAQARGQYSGGWAVVVGERYVNAARAEAAEGGE